MSPSAKVEAADLRRRNIDVVRTGQIVGVRERGENRTHPEGFQDALPEDDAVLLGLRLKMAKISSCLRKIRRAFNLEITRDIIQIGDGFLLQFGKMHSLSLSLCHMCPQVPGLDDQDRV